MPMLQPVASTVPDTVPAGLILAAVRSMLSRTNPVGVHATPAEATGAPVARSAASVRTRTAAATSGPRLVVLARAVALPLSTPAVRVQSRTINLLVDGDTLPGGSPAHVAILPASQEPTRTVLVAPTSECDRKRTLRL